MSGVPVEKQGFLGNLENKTTEELIDLLRRQESLLGKPKFLQSLADKGKKVSEFAEKLQKLISDRGVAGLTERKQSSESLNIVHKTPDSPTGSTINTKDLSTEEKHVECDIENELTVNGDQELSQRLDPSSGLIGVNVELSHMMITQNSPPESQPTFMPRDVYTDSSKTQPASVPKRGDFFKLVDRLGINSPELSQNDMSEELSHGLEKMILTSDNHGTKVDIGQGDGEVSCKFDEKLMKKSEEHVERNVKPKFKPNSSLKICDLADLPEDYKHKSRVHDQSLKDLPEPEPILDVDMSTSHSSGQVERGLLDQPPQYKYNKAKTISLEESCRIQKIQRTQLEEIAARHAAEKLAEKLGINMEKYNPEGTDMSYREPELDIDSDDDLE